MKEEGGEGEEGEEGFLFHKSAMMRGVKGLVNYKRGIVIP
jgi:hypothetical protein